MKTPSGPVFKAMKESTLKSMCERFMERIRSVDTDHFYEDIISQNQQKTVRLAEEMKSDLKKSMQNNVSAMFYEGELGGIKLKRTQTSQPFQTVPSVQLNYDLGFDKNSIMVESFSNKVRELVSLTREKNTNQMKIQAKVSEVMFTIQVDPRCDGAEIISSGKDRFESLMNSPKGQSSLLRFMDVLPVSSLSRIFFTMFCISPKLSITDDSIISEFLARLITYLNTSGKPKWIIAFIKALTVSDFEVLSMKRFQLSMLAAIFIRVRRIYEANSKNELLNQTMFNFATYITKDQILLRSKKYDVVLMRPILLTLLENQITCQKVANVLWLTSQ